MSSRRTTVHVKAKTSQEVVVELFIFLPTPSIRTRWTLRPVGSDGWSLN